MTGIAAHRLPKAIADLVVPCKICGTDSPLCDLVDYHEGCHDADGRCMNLAGVPVCYYRCPGCGFVFTRQFDEGAAEPDPTWGGGSAIMSDSERDHLDRRARGDLGLLQGWFGEALAGLHVLVLGSNHLANLLREAGCLADAWRPGTLEGIARGFAAGMQYDMALALDTLEAVTDPAAMMRALDRVMASDGLLLVSTRMSDGEALAATNMRGRPLQHVSPRLRQFSIYNACSLALLLGTIGFRLAGVKQGIHLGVRQLPAFAYDLFGDRLALSRATSPLLSPALMKPFPTPISVRRK